MVAVVKVAGGSRGPIGAQEAGGSRGPVVAQEAGGSRGPKRKLEEEEGGKEKKVKAVKAPATAPPKSVKKPPGSAPFPCLLCSDITEMDTMLSRSTSDLLEHYKICLYDQGLLFPLVPLGPPNTQPDGSPVEVFGARFRYHCPVRTCERSARKVQATSYKDYVFHCFQKHGVKKRAFEAAKQRAAGTPLEEKFGLLIEKVVGSREEEVGSEEVGRGEARLEELHTCVLCKGILKHNRKENKEARQLRMNICTTRNHYACCLYDTEEGRQFFMTEYPLDGEGGKDVRWECCSRGCRDNKRFSFITHKQFSAHMALYHGGLDKFIDTQGSQELRGLKERLVCEKNPETCFVPDHYGQ